MSENATRLVTVFGGSGFVGRHVVGVLAREGWRVRVAVRRPDLAFHLQPLGKVGQIQAVAANIRARRSVAAAVRGSSAVVNLIGILAPQGPQSFDAVHRIGAETIASAARDAGVTSFVHMSAIGADPEAISHYARSKGQGEQATLRWMPGGVILRPSIVFGPEDDFFNRFAAMARIFPALPLVGGGATRFQPVYVGDVAEAVAKGCGGLAKPGAVYELGGPEVRSFRELLEYVCTVTERERALAPLPFPLASLIAGATELAMALSLGLFPKMLAMTRDQVQLLKLDNIVSNAAILENRTLQGLDVRPTTMESIVPSYLYRFRKAGQFQR